MGKFQKFWVSLVFFCALSSLFPLQHHIVRHCVESRDFVRTHMSSNSKTMYHVVSGISLQSHRYVFGNDTAKLFSWDFQNCRWLCSCMKFVWFCWDFQICSLLVVWSLYLFVNALPFLICVLKLFSICVLKLFCISSAETGDGLFCFSSSILLLQYWPKQRVPNWCYSGITDNKQRHHNLLKFARNLFPQSCWRKLTQISRKTAENYVMLMKMAAN